MAQRSNITDVLILGGGPAGIAAGIALRQRDISCLIVEALEPSIDKACGEGLMPDARRSLLELGIELKAGDGAPFRGIRFTNPTHQVEAAFPHGEGIGVRRTRLHRRMVERARDLEVPVRWGSRVQLLDRGAALVNGEKLAFRYLIGADGQASGLRKWAGLSHAGRESIRFGFRRHYRVRCWSDYVEVHWGATAQAYLTPVDSDCLCAAFISRDPRLSEADLLRQFPAIAEKLKDAQPLSQLRGGVSATRRLHRVADSTVALIGDASGSVDAITGEGLALSFRQATALALAVECDDLKLYSAQHRKIGRLPHAMARLMLTMDLSAGMQQRAMKALSLKPELFRHLLSVHVGVESMQRFALRQGANLGWSLIEAGFY